MILLTPGPDFPIPMIRLTPELGVRLGVSVGVAARGRGVGFVGNPVL